MSLKLKNNFKKVIEDSDYKIPDDYFGVAKSILSEDKNIKDEYKDEFWGFVLSRTLAGKSGEKMHYAIHIPDDDWKRWHVNQRWNTIISMTLFLVGIRWIYFTNLMMIINLNL